MVHWNLEFTIRFSSISKCFSIISSQTWPRSYPVQNKASSPAVMYIRVFAFNYVFWVWLMLMLCCGKVNSSIFPLLFCKYFPLFAVELEMWRNREKKEKSLQMRWKYLGEWFFRDKMFFFFFCTPCVLLKLKGYIFEDCFVLPFWEVWCSVLFEVVFSWENVKCFKNIIIIFKLLLGGGLEEEDQKGLGQWILFQMHRSIRWSQCTWWWSSHCSCGED